MVALKIAQYQPPTIARIISQFTVAPQTFQAPILIERAGPSTKKKFFEFFTVPWETQGIRDIRTKATTEGRSSLFMAAQSSSLILRRKRKSCVFALNVSYVVYCSSVLLPGVLLNQKKG
jgi:hypothetical protein